MTANVELGLRAFTPASGASASMVSGKTHAVFAQSSLTAGLGI